MKFHVPDMSCGHCKTAIEAALADLDASAQITIDLAAHQVAVTSDATPAAILKTLDEIGFPARQL